MEDVNFCSRCGAAWEPGSEKCQECGMVLKRFRPSADYEYQCRVPVMGIICTEDAESGEQ